MMEAPQSPGGLPPEQNIDPNISPAPASPQSPEMPEDMMRADIESSLAELKAKNGAFESKRIANDNMSRERKIELLKKIFAKMEEMGIDPNDPEGIKGFLEMLNEKNPDLYILFENAMNELLPDKQQEVSSGGGGQPASIEEGPNLMDKYKGLQDGILRSTNNN